MSVMLRVNKTSGSKCGTEQSSESLLSLNMNQHFRSYREALSLLYLITVFDTLWFVDTTRQRQ